MAHEKEGKRAFRPETKKKGSPEKMKRFGSTRTLKIIPYTNDPLLMVL